MKELIISGTNEIDTDAELSAKNGSITNFAVVAFCIMDIDVGSVDNANIALRCQQ